jgi:hypothetical protein
MIPHGRLLIQGVLTRRTTTSKEEHYSKLEIDDLDRVAAEEMKSDKMIRKVIEQLLLPSRIKKPHSSMSLQNHELYTHDRDDRIQSTARKPFQC